MIRCLSLALLCDSGRFDEAGVLFEQLAANDFVSFPKDLEWLGAMTLLAEAAVVLKEAPRVKVLYELLLRYEGLVGLVGGEVSVGPVSRPLGLLASALGDWAAAEVHFDRAVEQARGMGSRPWQAHAEADWAAMLLARGQAEDRDRAVELVGRAGAAAEAMGMTWLAAQVADLSQQLGVRHSSTVRRFPAGRTELSAREREVAAFVAGGLTNRQIAEKLYLSERTAETHVQNIFTKLGFTSRAQLASWATRTGLAGGGAGSGQSPGRT